MECNVARVVDSFPDYPRAETITDGGQLRPRFISPAHDPIPAGTLIGASPQWRAVLKRAGQVASTDTTTCLQGESGTGKEVVARFIRHFAPQTGAIRRHQLRRVPGGAARIRVVWVRAWGLHWRPTVEAWPDRISQRRRALS